MRKKIKDLFASNFVKNVLLLSTSSLCAQLITAICVPAVIKLYGSEVFGVLSTFSAIVSLLLPLMTLGYSYAVNLPKSDQEAKEVALLAIIITSLFTIGCCIILLFLREPVSGYFHLEYLSNLLLALPLALFGAAFWELLQQWIARKKQFAIFTRLSISAALIINALKLLLGYCAPSALALVLVSSLFGVVQSVIYFFSQNKSKFFFEHLNLSIASLVGMSKKYSDFPIYRVPQLMIFSFSQNAPVLILANLVNIKTAGFYALAKMTMSVSSVFLGKSVGDVFYQRINEAVHHKEDISYLITKTTSFLAKISFLPFLIVVFWGPWFFKLVFGTEWLIAGECARWLAILYYFNLVRKPSFVSAPVLGMQKKLVVNELAGLIVQLLGLTFGLYFFKSLTLGVALFSLIGSVNYMLFISKLFARASNFSEAYHN